MAKSRSTSLEGFHPIVAQWFAERLGAPTPAQGRGWPEIRSGRDTLIAAPTGSGKTLAAFLTAIDDLLREGLERPLPDEVRVVYVSPLKALSADIHRNLAEPRREIRRLAEEAGLAPVRIHAAIRTGDTPQSERAAMLRKPPHILVTTPESLYLLLTAERSRAMLRTARTVIVDEIHAVLESRRGAHLALSLERLDHVTGRRLQRIGLSATQKPIEVVGEFLVGYGHDAGDRGSPGVRGAQATDVSRCHGYDYTPCAGDIAPRDEAPRARVRPRAPPSIVDEGHIRDLDLGIEVPGSPLEAVMAGEVWDEVYGRLAELVSVHRTTLVFVNTRRLAERVARHLADRLGEEAVTAHHGSLAKEVRLDAEERLKAGTLRALVATASLELGIDVGHVDLVCQLGSPRRIAALVQRVGRSGHTVGGTPKGRLFPLSRDDLIECAALLRAVRSGDLDRAVLPEKPFDVLAQQVAAEAASEPWSEDGLFALVRGAYPYRDLERSEFDDIVRMLGRGVSTRRGRRGALVHHDAVNHTVRGRRGTRTTAITSGGAIPEIADYRVVLEPEGTFIGTLNEDFAVESMAGDVFQLGNASWRILRILPGIVRVADAQGEPPNIPFWLGEAPARSAELSREVSRLRTEVEAKLAGGDEADAQRAVVVRGQDDHAPRNGGAGPDGVDGESADPERDPYDDRPAAERWLTEELKLPETAASQIVAYLGETRRLLGVIPSQQTIVLERFFDEAGGMQLVLHAPFGARINRAWGLSLRKKFCRTFNFELQAAATDDGLLLSLGPQHSFPLEDVFRFLQPETLEETLVQAVLDSPLFQTRWRWNTTLSLAVLRSRNGKKVPPQIQRMQAEDVLAAVFPDAAACFENIDGDREVPDHPLVGQTLRDCLEEAMDLPGLDGVVRRILTGELRCVARDTPEPSPLCHELLNARPYAFLDDAPLEERRTQAVYTRRALEPSSAADLGALDAAAIERVRNEAWPDAASAEELHDALLTCGFLRVSEVTPQWRRWLDALAADGRATRTTTHACAWWVATERVDELRTVHTGARIEPAVQVPAADRREWSREDALRELVRGRMEVLGPMTAAALAVSLEVDTAEVDLALLGLEAEGCVLRGSFTPGATAREWCDRRLLARIHRYTLNRLRSEIQPVTPAEFMRFLFHWQRVAPDERAAGLEGLAAVVEQLDGFEVAAGAWETHVLPARVRDYSPELLDMLCLTGRVGWGRLGGRTGTNGTAGGPVRTTPLALFNRRNVRHWRTLGARERPPLSATAQQLLDTLARDGASFFHELVASAAVPSTLAEQALGELVGAGIVTADSFAGLRALTTPSSRRAPLSAGRRRRGRTSAASVETAGRWSLLPPPAEPEEAKRHERAPSDAVEAHALALLARWGVVFRRIVER